MIPLKMGTPIEEYELANGKVYVKREDLCTTFPAPPFAKIRGLYYTLQDLIEQGYEYVGYMDTTISMASWGMCYLCDHFNMKIKPVVYYPNYKDGIAYHNIEKHIKVWESFGAELIPQQATRLSIMWHKAKNDLIHRHEKAYMLPQGLPSEYTLQNVAYEASVVPKEFLNGTVVMCVGSGVMAGGVIRGLNFQEKMPDIYGVLVSEKSSIAMKNKIYDYAGVLVGGIFGIPDVLTIVDMGFKYTQEIEVETPFPCNSYYDKKAWVWLLENYDKLKKPVLFWNIGANGGLDGAY